MIKVEYVLVDDLRPGEVLDIQEDRGHVVFRIARWLTAEEMIEVLNEGTRKVLAGGHWFQEWKGDIITVDPVRGLIPPPRPFGQQAESDAA